MCYLFDIETMQLFTVFEMTLNITQGHRQCHPLLDHVDSGQRLEK